MKLLMYLFPALVNLVQGATFFITVQRFTESGANQLIIGATTTAWALIYCLFNVYISRLANDRNAARLIIFGGGLIAISSAGFLIFDGLYTQFVWLALLGVAFGFYCAPFQVFMKRIESGVSGGVSRAAGRYTTAWSLGFASGPLVFGLLNAEIGFSICLAIGVLVMVGIFFIDRKFSNISAAASVGEADAPVADGDAGDKPDFAWVGWIVGGVGTFTIFQIRTMLQPLGESLDFSKENLSWLLFTVSCVQGLTAFALSFTKKWMFKALPALLTGVVGTIALLIISFSVKLPWFLAAAAIYGVYSGIFYFLFVYYSLLHPTKAARNAGVNEIVVAIGGICGPLLGGALANFSAVLPFLAGAACVVAATVLHVAMTLKLKKKKVAIKIELLENCLDLMPAKAHDDDAAYDLRARCDMLLPVRRSILVPAGFKMELPYGYEAQIRPRSGLALKHDIMLTNSPGTIDAGYRGEVGIIIYNGGTEEFPVKRGDRIAQMVINKLPETTLLQVESLSDSLRGKGGFGSSGKA